MLRPHPEEQRQDVWFQEEARAERQANLIRLLYMVMWLSATIPGVLLPPPTGSASNIGTGMVWFLAAAAYHLYLTRRPYRPGFKYLSTTFDVLMISANLFFYHYDMGYSTTLKAPPFMNFMLALLLAAFRFNRRLPLYGTALAIGAYATLFLVMVATQPVEFGTPLELFTTPKINFVYQLYRVAYLVTLAMLLFILVGNVQRLVRLRVEEAEQTAREKAERERTQALFERYFSPEIARYLTDHPQDMGGRMQHVTVMLTDLRNFTGLSETLGPAATVDLLNRLFSQLTRIVFQYNGTIDKFTGDGMLIVFGTPTPHPDDPLRAVQCAWGMLNAVRAIDSSGPLRLGLAIHTGDAIFGNIGSPQRMELTVIGDVVNTTSRIEALNKEFGTDLIISDTTYGEIAGHVTIEKLPKTQLRGRSGEIELYAVKDVLTSASVSQTATENRHTL